MSGNAPKKPWPKEGNSPPNSGNDNATSDKPKPGQKRCRGPSAAERPILAPTTTTNRTTPPPPSPQYDYNDDTVDMEPSYDALRSDSAHEPQHTQDYERTIGIKMM
jgi:hypothetical protein